MPPSTDPERPRTSDDPAFSDAVTFAFADAAAGVQGVLRLGVAGGRASGLALVFRGGAPVVTSAEGAVELDGPAERYDDVAAAGVDVTTVDPGRRWSVSLAAQDGSVDLEFTAVGALLELADDHEASQWGGMTGNEQPCRVRGSATLGGQRLKIDGLGQRGRLWGAPDWTRIELARTITGWFGDDVAFSLSAMRPSGSGSHADEVAWAAVSRAPSLVHDPDDDEGDDAPAPSTSPVAVLAPEPRISTTTDADGRHVRATVELWESDSGPVWTATGEAVAGTTMELGRLRLDSAFFRWRLAGREGTGRYDVLRRVAD